MASGALLSLTQVTTSHPLSSLPLTPSPILGVFTELIRKIGVQGVQMEELVTLEDEELNQIK